MDAFFFFLTIFLFIVRVIVFIFIRTRNQFHTLLQIVISGLLTALLGWSCVRYYLDTSEIQSGQLVLLGFCLVFFVNMVFMIRHFSLLRLEEEIGVEIWFE